MNTRKPSRRRAIVELLEIRKLLTTVNITDFGAIPNDGQNDSGAIQNAIAHSNDGDTIYFPKGTYNIGTTLNPAGNRNYIGANGAILQSADTTHHVFHITQDNIRIENFTFNGDPIVIDKPNNQMVQNLVINGNDFHAQASGQNCNAITFNTGLRNSAITNNSFGPLQTDNGIYGYYWDNLTIANNEFIHGNEGIHLTDFGNLSKNLLIEQNYFSHLHRMGIELQGGGHDAIIQDNYYDTPDMTPNFHDNDSTFAYSIIDDTSEGNIIRRNTAISLERPDGVGVRIAFEVGGDNTQVTDNYVVGTNAVLADTDGNGTTSVLVKGNRWGGYRQGPGGYGLTLSHNGPNVQLDWNPGRGKPGPFKRLTADGVIDETSLINLSDLKWNSAVSSWGPAELDQTNGHNGADDGSTMSLNGMSYDNGVGVAGDSQIVYNLAGKYSQFFSDIGIDDAAGANGSATFEVFADGKKIFDSGLITGLDSKQSLSLDVSGVKQLKLITTDGGDGMHSDVADWANAQLLPSI
jgi:hypothetical protein